MSTRPMLKSQGVQYEQSSSPHLTYIQRAILRRGPPRHIIIGIVGGIWTFYFLWMHNWIWAVATLLVSTILGRVATSGVNERKLAHTKLGKIMLLHLHPANIVIQSFGIAALLYGGWIHSTAVIMAAVSIILFGHLWGWHDVHDAL